MVIEINGYLTQEKLEQALKKLVGENWISSEFMLPNKKFRWDFAFKQGGKITLVEFEGDSHYRDPTVIKRDKQKDELALCLGYKVVRIPYWVQLTSETAKFYFNFDCEIKQDFPHGFIVSKWLPASFCEQGVLRFHSELKLLPQPVRDSVLFSLAEKIERLGLQFVLPKFLYDIIRSEDLPFVEDYYQEYKRLGGKSSFLEYNNNLRKFFNFTLAAFTGGDISCSRDISWSMWQSYIGSSVEADLYLQSVDNIHAYT